MTAVEVLNQVLKAGGRVIPDPDRPRLLVPQNLKPIVQKHREVLRVLVGQSSALAAAYRRYWGIEETDPLETFRAAYREIVSLETRLDPEVAWRTLREAAIAYHAEMGTCPFCQERGPLHLPAEQIDRELSEHGKAERG